MTLDMLDVGQKAVVRNITNCNKALKNRFYSFGIVKDSILYLEEVTLAKNTIEIKVNQSKVALRLSEASYIEIDYAK